MVKRTHESEELYPALGRFITSFAEIEHWLSCILGVLTDDEENIWLTLFFIDEMMIGRVRDKIHAVAKLRLEDNEELLKKLKATLSEVEKLARERNKLVHGQWIFHSTITKLHNYKIRRTKTEKGGHLWERLEDKAVFPNDLKQLTEKSDELADRLGNLREEIEQYLEAVEKRIQKLVKTAASAMEGN